MNKQKSDIPQGVEERLIREYRQQGNALFFQINECILNGQVVGQRAYDNDGNLRIETPLKDGKKHGREFIWNENGELESIEPFVDGKMHGLAKQYGRNGKFIGTYRFVHGTGYDIWRSEGQDGSIEISEIFSVQNGSLHGYEWWLRADQRSVWHERHWQEGMVHGIERVWIGNGRLKPGYPKFWIRDQAASKQTYLKAAEQDQTLPAYQAKEDRPQRQFPTEIEQLLS